PARGSAVDRMRTSLPVRIVGDGLRRVTAELCRREPRPCRRSPIMSPRSFANACMATIGLPDATPLRLDESCGALATLRRSIRAFLAFSERVSREAGLSVDEYQ